MLRVLGLIITSVIGATLEAWATEELKNPTTMTTHKKRNKRKRKKK